MSGSVESAAAAAVHWVRMPPSLARPSTAVRDPDALAVYDRARLARDARFDGRFFIAITSTGIYCRPICPSRTANREHVCYFTTATAAETEGFRPCLRCRPEASPGTPAW